MLLYDLLKRVKSDLFVAILIEDTDINIKSSCKDFWELYPSLLEETVISVDVTSNCGLSIVITNPGFEFLVKSFC